MRRNYAITLAIVIIFALVGLIVWTQLPSKHPSKPVTQKPDAPKEIEISFNQHIRPILSENCFSCHGFDSTTRKEGLRLDTEEGALSALQSNPNQYAVVPGKPEESAIWKRIFSDNPHDVMPPPEAHKTLSDEEKAMITTWIEQGAPYQEHWAFSPIVSPPVDPESDLHPIDYFIRKKLDERDIKPSPEADKNVLIRRLTLDLTGLPPTPEEVEHFIADRSENAYEKLVDRLLASPHYGERMAVPWLDVVRFADTVGYHGDQNTNIFPYRDYVIDSLNSNKPFDVFTKEQLAGDLLPDPTDEQKIATGFLRLNLMTREGGAQPGEYLAKSAADRVRAVGATWLGLTTGCAECHDHKFDPFTAMDFYSMSAFFSDLTQWGVYMHYDYTPNEDLLNYTNDSPFPPEIYTKNRTQMARLQLAREAVLNSVDIADVDSGTLENWHQTVKTFLEEAPEGWLPLSPVSVTADKGTEATLQNDGTVLFSGEPISEEVFTVKFNVPENYPVKALRLEALPDETNGGMVGRQENGKFQIKPTFSIDGNQLEIAYRQAEQRTPESYKNGVASPYLEETWTAAPARFEQPLDAASHPQTAVYHLNRVNDSIGLRTLEVKLESADIGKIRLSITPFADAIPGQELVLDPTSLQTVKNAEAKHPRVQQLFQIATLPSDQLPKSYLKARESLVSLRGGYAYSMVSIPLAEDKIPPTHLLHRGNWMEPKDEVRPAFPKFLQTNETPTETRLNRLDLADWITSAENPLTARHYVNRVWKQLFGKGLSNVLNDLGNQSEWPSHPKLLDWLASEFIQSGWDMKHITKTIVMSETYRQTAKITSERASKDPGNRLLSAQSPRRLDAEFVRDNALAIAGTLSKDLIGGPSILPYQPDNYWEILNFPRRGYPTSTGDYQFRRGLYTHWQRTFTHPMMTAFDAPSREICTNDRYQSNSPQQALTLLNDPTFVEAAEDLATSVKSRGDDLSDEQIIDELYLRALARQPSPEEKAELLKFLADLREQGLSVDPIEQLSRVVLNLHETITRY